MAWESTIVHHQIMIHIDAHLSISYVRELAEKCTEICKIEYAPTPQEYRITNDISDFP